MKLKVKISLFVWLLSLTVVIAQDNQFHYMRKLEGISNQWHKIILPNSLYAQLNYDFSDIRILGITSKGDTVEAPYILDIEEDEHTTSQVGFNMLNKVKNRLGYFYTFEVPLEQVINQILLDFNVSNFDWLVNLEGSQNQEEWFTIVTNKRILSIENSYSSYKYTTLKFEDVKFKYLRLSIPSKNNPQLTNVTIEKSTLIKGQQFKAAVASQTVIVNKATHQSEIEIKLSESVPISFIKIHVLDTIDYYRTFTCKYVSDSINNTNGWHYLYTTLFSGTLSSLENNEFGFSNTVMKHLKIVIDNNDNQPLAYSQCLLQGDVHTIKARFSVPATYYLVYGNKQANLPYYDINRFENHIPAKLVKLNIGDEVEINRGNKNENIEPLFKNSIWLWSTMILIIFILGWFSLRMMRKQ